jgi:phosphoglycolate phosphatase-like HAD superfamily hydrolase
MSIYNNIIFDFDGTLITTMQIDYPKMKNELQKILQCENMNSMYESINIYSKNEKMKKDCYDLIDKYESDSLKHVKINNSIMEMYLKSKYKIIVSRNGITPITYFFKNNNLPMPDFISCRNNCIKLKPHQEQIDIIFNNFNQLNKNNITIVGDSWHDEELAKNIGCEFLNSNLL